MIINTKLRIYVYILTKMTFRNIFGMLMEWEQPQVHNLCTHAIIVIIYEYVNYELCDGDNCINWDKF